MRQYEIPESYESLLQRAHVYNVMIDAGYYPIMKTDDEKRVAELAKDLMTQRLLNEMLAAVDRAAPKPSHSA